MSDYPEVIEKKQWKSDEKYSTNGVFFALPCEKKSRGELRSCVYPYHPIPYIYCTSNFFQIQVLR